MTTTAPSTLRLRVLRLHPRLVLIEVQLVDSSLLYRRLDARDHVPNEVHAVRPLPSDWAELRHVLDEAEFSRWPRRWPRVTDGYEGEFAIAVKWDGRAITSAGALGVAPVGAVLDEVSWMACAAGLHAVSCGGASACQPPTRYEQRPQSAEARLPSR